MRGMHDLFVLATLACLIVQGCRDKREDWHFGHLCGSVGGKLAGIGRWAAGMELISITLHAPGDPPYAPQNYPRLSSNKSMRGFQSRMDGSRQLPYTRPCGGRGMLFLIRSHCPMPTLLMSETSNSGRRYVCLLARDECVYFELGPLQHLDEAVEGLVAKHTEQGPTHSRLVITQLLCCAAVTCPGTGTPQKGCHTMMRRSITMRSTASSAKVIP